MLRLTKTGIGLLTRQYRSVLRKCWLINAGLFILGAAVAPSNAAAEVSALSSTLDRIRTESLAFLGTTHGNYTLTTSKGSNTNRIVIGGVTYYYTPNEGSADANQKLINLVNTAGGAMVSSTIEPDNYVFKVDNGDSTFTYYSYDTSDNGAKFAQSGIKISTTSTGAAGEQTVTQSKADGTTVTYYINHETPSGYDTGTQNTNLTENINDKAYSGLTSSANNQGGALTVASGNTVDYITGDFSGNSSTGSSQTRGGAIFNAGTIGNVTADFYENTAASRGGAIGSGGQIVSIVGDFYGNSATTSDATGGALNLRSGKTDLIMGNFINNTANGGKDGGAINLSDGHTVDKIIGSFVGNSVQNSSANRAGGAIKVYQGTINYVNADFTDNSAINGGAIGLGGGNDPKIVSLNGTFVSNSASQDGGALYSSGSQVNGISGEFVNNTAGRYGGAIYTTNASFGNTSGITASFTDNSAQSGGAIYNAGGRPMAVTGNFTDNSATAGDGGAIYNTGNFQTKGNGAGMLPAINGNFTGNTASGKGGAIFNTGTGDTNVGRIAWIVGNFEDNSATYGGAVYNEGDQFVTNKGATSDFINNTASQSGGAIYNAAAGIVGNITGKFVENEATANYGGAIYNEGTIGNITGVLDSTSGKTIAFSGNTATRGGAIYTETTGSIGDITGDVSDNTANNGSGGAIRNGGTIGDITGNITNNTASDHGGAIFNLNEMGAITGDITDNTATSADGGAIYNGGTMEDITGKFVENEATAGSGGAIYNVGTVGNITGTLDTTSGKTIAFSGNTATTAGAIWNNTDATIGDITGDIVDNTATTTSGGAIINYNGTIGNISGDISHNTAVLQGGAISNNGTIGNIVGNISNNTAGTLGGAIVNGGIMGTITGNITNNTATAGDGGAIHNSGTLGTITGNVTGNSAGGLGGAIYTTQDISIATDDDNDILFSNNRDSSGYNDIYTKGGDISLSAEDDRTITFNGSILGTDSTGATSGDYAINATGGNYVFNNNVSAKTINLTNVDSVKLGTFTQANSTTSTGKLAETIDVMTITGSGTSLDLQNGEIDSITITDLTLNSPVAMAIDANLQNKTLDSMHATTIAGTGSFIIDAINVLIDSSEELDSVQFTLTTDSSQYDKYAISSDLINNIQGTESIFKKATYENGVLTLESGLTLTALYKEIGEWSDGNYLVAYDDTSKATSEATSVGANLQLLDTAIGKVTTDGNYIKAYDSADVENTSIAANLIALDNAVYNNYTTLDTKIDSNYDALIDTLDEFDTDFKGYMYDQFQEQVPGVKAIKIDVAGKDSKSYVEDNAGKHYTLSETSSATSEALTVAVKEGNTYVNKTYYYTPRSGDTEIAQLINSGYATFAEVSDADVHWVFTDGKGNYWKLDDTSAASYTADKQYTLSTTSGGGKIPVVIDGTTYYFKPATTDTQIADLISGGATFNDVPYENANWVFTDGTKHWTLDTTKHSGTKIVESNSNDYNYAQEQADGTIRYYKVIHVVPKGYTQATERMTNITESIDKIAFYDLEAATGAGAVSVKAGSVVDHIVADFKGNSTKGELNAAGAVYVQDGSVLNNLTGSFEANIGNFGGVVQNKGTIGHILGDFVNNEDTAGGAAIDNNGTIDMIVGDFLGNFDKHRKTSRQAVRDLTVAVLFVTLKRMQIIRLISEQSAVSSLTTMHWVSSVVPLTTKV